MKESALPLVRPVILMASIFVSWLIARRHRPNLRRIFYPHGFDQAWMINALLFLVSASILYSSTVSIVSTVSTGIRALLFADPLLYANAPWLRWLFAGSLFWLLVAMLLVGRVLGALRGRAADCSWPLSRLEITALFIVLSAILAEIMSQGQNVLMDLLGPSLSSMPPDNLAGFPIYILLGDLLYGVILAGILWTVKN